MSSKESNPQQNKKDSIENLNKLLYMIKINHFVELFFLDYLSITCIVPVCPVSVPGWSCGLHVYYMYR